MKFVLNTTALLLLIPFLCINTATATTFDFNYSKLSVSPGSTQSSVEMTADGIAVEVKAYSIENNGSGLIFNKTELGNSNTGVYVSSSASGNLGVRSNTYGDGTSLDGGSGSGDLDEGLLFTFDTLVHLDYINFDHFTSGNADDFNLTVDGVLLLYDFNANDSSSLVTNVVGEFDEYNFQGIIGKEFLFWADGNSDSFRIDEIEVSAVPVPAAVWLMSSGLLGLFGFSSKRSQIAV
jgi:hypothetical protein